MNFRILGAFLIGTGLLSVSLFMTSKNMPGTGFNTQTNLVAAAAPVRGYIPITDSDGDGIPDWRKNLREATIIKLATAETASSTYTPPTTLTGQLAIDLLQRSVLAEGYGEFGESEESILNSAQAMIMKAASDKLYTRADIIISDDNSIEALERYGARVAEIALVRGVPGGTENEAVITKNAMDKNNPALLAELELIAVAYEALRDDMLREPVPRSQINHHTNLTNAYHALSVDVRAMQQAFTDPLLTMTRLKRYQDDADGLYYSLINLYGSLRNDRVVYSATDLPPQVFHFLNIW